jgi:hypothetical protein
LVLFETISIKFSANIVSKLKKKYAGTALYSDAIWEEFCEQH